MSSARHATAGNDTPPCAASTPVSCVKNGRATGTSTRDSPEPARRPSRFAPAYSMTSTRDSTGQDTPSALSVP
nr:hypothetical protein [Eggerthella sinensis]